MIGCKLVPLCVYTCPVLICCLLYCSVAQNTVNTAVLCSVPYCTVQLHTIKSISQRYVRYLTVLFSCTQYSQYHSAMLGTLLYCSVAHNTVNTAVLCSVPAAVTCISIHDHDRPVYRGPIAQMSAGVFHSASVLGYSHITVNAPGAQKNLNNKLLLQLDYEGRTVWNLAAYGEHWM